MNIVKLSITFSHSIMNQKLLFHIFRLNCKHDNAVLKHHSAVHLTAPLRNVDACQQQGLWHFVTAPAWRNARFI